MMEEQKYEDREKERMESPFAEDQPNSINNCEGSGSHLIDIDLGPGIDVGNGDSFSFRIRESRNYSMVIASLGLSVAIGMFSTAGAHIPNTHRQHQIALLLMIPCLIFVLFATYFMIAQILKKNTKLRQMKLPNSYSGKEMRMQGEHLLACMETEIEQANKALKYIVGGGVVAFLILFGYEYHVSFTQLG